MGGVQLLLLLDESDHTSQSAAIGRSLGRNDKSCGIQNGQCLQGHCTYQKGKKSMQKILSEYLVNKDYNSQKYYLYLHITNLYALIILKTS